MERRIEEVPEEFEMPKEVTIEIEPTPKSLEQEMAEYDLTREQVELFAQEEEERLERDAIEARNSGGILRKLAGYRRYVSAFVLGSVIAGFASRKSPEQLDEIGELAEQQSEIKEEAWSGESEAELLAQIDKHAIDVGKKIDEFKQAPFAEKVLTSFAQQEPDVLLPFLLDIQDQPYLQAVVDTMVTSDPEYAVHIVDTFSAGEEVLFNKQTALVVSGIDSSDNPEVKALRELIQSPMADSSKRLVSQVFQYVFDQGISLDAAQEIANDEHRYVDALLYTLHNGVGEESMRARTSLESLAIDRVMEMNELKGKGSRFEAVKGASANELYATIVFGGDAARPSTAMPLFDRLFKAAQAEGRDAAALIDGVESLEYHQFIALATENGRLDDFLNFASSPEQKSELVKRILADVEQGDTDKKLSALAEVLVYGKKGAELDAIKRELEREYRDAERQGDKRAQAAYGVLSGLLGKEATWIQDRASEFEVETNDALPVSELLNDRGENVQAYYFYNDPDGYASFVNFVVTYKSQPGWKVQDHGTFVEVKKQQSDRSVLIYANKPMASVGGESEFMALQDAKSAEKLMAEKGMVASVAHVPDSAWAEGRPDGFADMNDYMESHDRSPSVQVHRGHVYWNQFTYDEVRPDVKLMFDGSCGGASDIEAIRRTAPDAQLVYNSEEGMAGINDSILANINERILSGKDIEWSNVKAETEKDVIGFYEEDREPEARRAFAKYIFPSDTKAKAAAVEAKFHQLIEGQNSI